MVMLVRLVRLVRVVLLVSVVLTCQVLGLIMPPLQRCRHPTGPPGLSRLYNTVHHCTVQRSLLGDQLYESRPVERRCDQV